MISANYKATVRNGGVIAFLVQFQAQHPESKQTLTVSLVVNGASNADDLARTLSFLAQGAIITGSLEADVPG